MKELTKDLIYWFILGFGFTFPNILPQIFPYLISYYNYYNQEMTLRSALFMWSFEPIGYLVANIIIPKLFVIFGINIVMIIGSLINLGNMLLFISFPYYFFIYLNGIVMGVTLQIFSLASGLFFSEKYENGI